MRAISSKEHDEACRITLKYRHILTINKHLFDWSAQAEHGSNRMVDHGCVLNATQKGGSFLLTGNVFETLVDERHREPGCGQLRIVSGRQVRIANIGISIHIYAEMEASKSTATHYRLYVPVSTEEIG